MFEMKRCSRCKQEYPESLEYFRPAKRYKNGLFCWCRGCELDYKQDPEHRKQHKKNYYKRTGGRPFVVKTKDGQRQCRNCKEWFPLNADCFHRNKSPGNGGFCYECVFCSRSKHKQYYLTHTEQVKLNSQRWKDNNPERAAELAYTTVLRRRARIRSLPNDFNADDWEAALSYFNNTCAVCGKSPDFWTILAADHWIPLSDKRLDNPGTTPWNIIPMCHSKKGVPEGESACNHSKHHKDPVQWLIERYGHRKAKEIAQRVEIYFEWVRQRKAA